MALLEVIKAEARYYGSKFELKDVDFVLDKGQRLVVYGAENSGKTTLLRVLCGLEEYCGGSITLDGTPLKELTQKEMNVGFTFDARILDGKATVQDTISYPMKLRGVEQRLIDGYIEKTADKCNLPMQSPIKDLNDMQVAKLILARLFAIERKLYLIDDVWKDLPDKDKREVIAFLKGNIEGKSVIIATDDRTLAREIVQDKVIVLTEKQVLRALSSEEISERPLNMQSAHFAGYELHLGRLAKVEGNYFADLYGQLYGVARPIDDIYVDKKVCFAIRRSGALGETDEVGDGEVMSFYYDKDNERIISHLR